MTKLTVGNGQKYTTLSAAVAAAKSGDTVDLKPGTYTNDFPALIDGLTIEGVGGIAKLVATAQPGNGKAILDVAGTTTLKNLDISGVTVPDANGAAIRYESGKLVIENTAIHGNQDGILGASDPTGSITIDKSEIYDNGTASGSTHNIYIGDIAHFTLTNSYIHGANTGHEVKSRAESNTITNDRIEDNSSTASYEIDLPNGGNATISGNTIQKSANSGNHVTFAYGEEGSPHAGTTVSIIDNTFVSDQSGADVVWDATGVPITASGNTTYHYSQIDKAGHVSSSGFTATSTRPALDTSSPIDKSGGSGASTPTPPADITAPSLTVKETAYGISNGATDTISGTVRDSGSGVAKVEIYDTTGGRTVDLGSATLANGAFTRVTAGLSNGSHAFSAIATDKAGNATHATSAGATLTVDTIAPSLSATESVSGRTTRTSTVISGTASDSGTGIARIEIYDTTGGKTVDLGRATLNGSAWSFTAGNLALGNHAFSAVATDKAGNATASVSAGASETIVRPGQTPTPGKTGSTSNGNSQTAGSTQTDTEGSWSINAKTTTASTGSLVLPSNMGDTVSAAADKPDVFADFASIGRDLIDGYAAAASGANHGMIDLGSTAAGVIRVSPLHTITLSGVDTHSLTPNDVRFT